MVTAPCACRVLCGARLTPRLVSCALLQREDVATAEPLQAAFAEQQRFVDSAPLLALCASLQARPALLLLAETVQTKI